MALNDAAIEALNGFTDDDLNKHANKQATCARGIAVKTALVNFIDAVWRCESTPVVRCPKQSSPYHACMHTTKHAQLLCHDHHRFHRSPTSDYDRKLSSCNRCQSRIWTIGEPKGELMGWIGGDANPSSPPTTMWENSRTQTSSITLIGKLQYNKSACVSETDTQVLLYNCNGMFTVESCDDTLIDGVDRDQ